MKTNTDESALLSRGGRPTLGDLLDRLEFSPTRGSIALNGACMTLTSLDAATDCFTIDISAESLDKTAGLAEPELLYERQVSPAMARDRPTAPKKMRVEWQAVK